MGSARGHGFLVVAGPPCAGKSSVARLLAQESWGADNLFIEVDALFSALLPQSDRNRSDGCWRTTRRMPWPRAAWEPDRSPILECTYARLEQRASLVAALADIPQAPLWVVELVVTPDEAVERFRERVQATDLDERLVRERAEAFPYSGNALRIESATAAPDELARQISTWWADQPSPVDQRAWAEAGIGWD